MENYKKTLYRIEKEWADFMKSERFFDEEENRMEKMKIKKLIVQVWEDKSLSKVSKNQLIENSIRVLGEHTGCAEDLMISDEIMKALMEKKILDANIYDVFFSKSPMKRWL
ncbi:hypothetical protein [Myroides sp. DF42-4-2]|uniref:hypothetical protein n=1 Tax=unclassified Myroides TaxID=2642485 RepID=UPI0025759510|nr:hypothetical protein [Myroides sp. DF42-4-2]MDM1406966.1 hypothetical protein [Myroides sp. DF42-4-2]